MHKYNTGFVLSGGAALGFIHLGVLQAFEEENVRPDIISAVSSGSIAGAFYADGYSPREIMDIYKNKNIFELIRITVPKTGLFNANGLRKTLKDNLRTKTLEDLKTPLIISVTNILKGKIEYLDKGPVADAVMASSCIPGMFEMVNINGVPYVDGGVLNNMPVEPLLKKCKKLIGVYLIPSGEIDKLRGITHVVERAFYLTISVNAKEKADMFDMYISPKDTSRFGIFDTRKAGELFKIGYDTATEALKK